MSCECIMGTKRGMSCTLRQEEKKQRIKAPRWNHVDWRCFFHLFVFVVWCAELLTRSPSGNNDSIPEACELIKDEKMAALSGPFISLEGGMLEKEDVSRKKVQSGPNHFSLAHLLLACQDHPGRSASPSEHWIPLGGGGRDVQPLFWSREKRRFI